MRWMYGTSLACCSSMLTASSTSKSTRSKGVNTIAPEALLQCLASGRSVLVIDVREFAEIERSRWRVPGALQIPIHQLFVRRNELLLRDVAMVVTVSNDGVRSRAAALALSLLGLADVRSLDGGLEAWARKGLPRAWSADGDAAERPTRRMRR